MKEMDIIFERFLAQGYHTLSDSQREEFEVLLDQPDQDILGWLTGQLDPSDSGFSTLVETIKSTSIPKRQ